MKYISFTQFLVAIMDWKPGAVKVPLTFQAKIPTSGSVSDEAVGQNLRRFNSQLLNLYATKCCGERYGL